MAENRRLVGDDPATRLYLAAMAEKAVQVAVIGGGLAGLSTAVALAPRGFAVTLFESRNRLGGRASSFTDPESGQLIDACQHVSMGCCTNYHHLCETIGVQSYLAPQPALYFMTPDRRVSRFAPDPWPAPFHLGRTLLGAHYLTMAEKLRIIYGLGWLLATVGAADPPLLPWLQAHRQTPRTIDRFWSVVLTSALNESVDRVGLKYARKVFRDGFITHRDGFTVHVPTVPLGRLYGPELRSYLEEHGVQLQENAGVRHLVADLDPDKDQRRVSHLVLRDGREFRADYYVLAVPFDRITDLVPDAWKQEPWYQAAKQLQPSPIVSVHLWYDAPVLDRPQFVLVDCLGQWVFSRGELAPGEHYIQVVVSAARPLRGLGHEEVRRQIVQELNQLFPKTRTAKLLRSKVVTEHSATFSAVPGIDSIRPAQQTAIANLILAGDWTQTGWPATMEGAVRSGYLAGEALLARLHRPEQLVQPDLAG